MTIRLYTLLSPTIFLLYLLSSYFERIGILQTDEAAHNNVITPKSLEFPDNLVTGPYNTIIIHVAIVGSLNRVTKYILVCGPTLS